MTLFARLAITAAVAAAWLPMAHAQQWSAYANISETMGTNAGRLCMAEASRGDIGCPTYAPSLTTTGDVSITGNLSAAKFIGDGSGLTGMMGGDRITSGTTSVIVNQSSNISITAAKPGEIFRVMLNNTDVGNTSGTMTSVELPVYNGAAGLSIRSMGAATGGFNSGNYDAFIHTSQANSYLHFAAGSQASSLTKHLTIAPSGNVGIGKDNPVAKLDISGTTYIGTDPNNRVRIESGLIRMQDSTDAGRSLEIQATKLFVAQNNPAGSTAGTALMNALTSSDNAQIFKFMVNNQQNGYAVMEQRTTSSYRLAFQNNGNPQLLLHNNGNIGIGIASSTAPSTSLHVSGTLRLASGGEGCDAHRAGAIRYTDSQFQVCYGTGGWANLTDASATLPAADRIISGSTYVTANQNGSISLTVAGSGRMSLTSGGAANISATAYIGTDPNNRVRIESGLIRMQDSTDAGRSLSIQATKLMVGENNPAGTVSWINASTALVNAITSADNSHVFKFMVNQPQNGYAVMEQRTTSSYRLAFQNNGNPQFLLHNNGNIGIGIASSTAPSTSLHISGTLRLASGGEGCDAHRAGAIRYAGNQFQVCYGTGGWANLSDASSTAAAAERITSGTMQVIANQNGNSVSFTENGITTGYFYGGNLIAGGVSTTGKVSATGLYVNGNVGIGTPPTSTFLLALPTSTTVATITAARLVTGYGGNPDNFESPSLNYMGNGLTLMNSGEIRFYSASYDNNSRFRMYAPAVRELNIETPSTANVSRLRFRQASSGQLRTSFDGVVGIGIATPTTPLEVSGTVSATTLQLADNPDATCGPATYGTFKVMNGRPYFCRP